MEPILQTLTDLNIPYEIQEHKAIFSEKDVEALDKSREPILSMNLNDLPLETRF